MYNLIRVLGISIIGMIIGFSIIACDDGYRHSHIYSNGFCSGCGDVEMVKISAGTFKMGSPSTEPNRYSDEDERSADNGNVTLSGFYMAKYPVTQGLWKNVVKGANPSYFKGDNLPVELVSWYEAIEFCNALSVKQGLTKYYTINKTIGSDPNNTSNTDKLKYLVTPNEKANGYRLPTEAQWEYACRAGTETAFNWGTNTITSAQANYHGSVIDLYNTVKGESRRTTTPVNTFTPNAWGLYDMHGNVWEWCWDWYADSYNDAGGSKNPRGAVVGEARVSRGGSWFYYGQSLRSACRVRSNPSHGYDDNGIRLVRP